MPRIIERRWTQINADKSINFILCEILYKVGIRQKLFLDFMWESDWIFSKISALI